MNANERESIEPYRPALSLSKGVHSRPFAVHPAPTLAMDRSQSSFNLCKKLGDVERIGISQTGLQILHRIPIP